jgi:L-arabinonolactonase
MKNKEVEVVGDVVSRHGEGPVWSADEQKLYWTDIESRLLWQLDPATGRTRSWKTKQKVCSFAFRERGGLLVAFESGLSFFDLDTGALEWIMDVEPDKPTTRLNDGRCDRQGRFIVGGYEPGGRSLTAAYRLDPDLSLHELFGGLASANSTCFSPDGRTMYFADTPKAVIWAFDYDIDTGVPSGRRVFCDFHDQPGIPDGSIIDSEGCLWNAQWNGARVVRYRPDGAVDRIIEMPCPNPSSLAFGGRDLDTLYITTSRLMMNDAQIERWPLSGSLCAVRTDVKGLPETKFRG